MVLSLPRHRRASRPRQRSFPLGLQLGLIFLALGLAPGCAIRARHPDGMTKVIPNLAGVWEGLARDTLSDGIGTGDTRIERQAWRLQQNGERLIGFYILELTMISGDGRPYLCNREPRFSTVLRFDIQGHIGQDGIELTEVGDVRAKGSCSPTFHTPTRFQAELHGEVMTLHDSDHKMTLYRRAATEQKGAERELLRLAAADDDWKVEGDSFPRDPARPSLNLPPVNLEGIWVWENRGALPTGDEKLEREEWHLSQEGNRVAGYYDRAVRQISTDGAPYRCNSSTDFRVVTRYRVAGEVDGDQITLYERAFEILEASPCDNGQRRLDAYQGHAAGTEIRLMWGVGTQVLHRARPDVPSQRF